MQFLKRLRPGKARIRLRFLCSCFLLPPLFEGVEWSLTRRATMLKLLPLLTGSVCLFVALNGSGYPVLDAANGAFAFLNFGIYLDNIIN